MGYLTTVTWLVAQVAPGLDHQATWHAEKEQHLGG